MRAYILIGIVLWLAYNIGMPKDLSLLNWVKEIIGAAK